MLFVWVFCCVFFFINKYMYKFQEIAFSWNSRMSKYLAIFFGTHVRNHWPQSANFKNSSHVFVGYVFFFCYSLKVISWLCFHFYKYSHSGSVSILSCRFIQHILENHNKKCSIHSLAFVYSGSVSMIKMNWNFKNKSIPSYFDF